MREVSNERRITTEDSRTWTTSIKCFGLQVKGKLQTDLNDDYSMLWSPEVWQAPQLYDPWLSDVIKGLSDFWLRVYLIPSHISLSMATNDN